MRRSDFHYELPAELIAQQPPARRDAARLLFLDGASGATRDRRFPDLPDLLRPGDLLVLNRTRVIPARLFAARPTGGRVEVLIERLLGADTALAWCRSSKPLRAGATLDLPGGGHAVVAGRRETLFELRFDVPLTPLLEAHGHVPLPPYIRRPDAAADRERYQTVYGDEPGAVAAPTAGLHFDRPMLDRLAAAGIAQATVTLHVGAGTFEPLREEEVARNRLHSERFVVDEAACAAVAAARERGGRVVAVGTTSVRALETAAGADGRLRAGEGETELFITPGYRFRAVDALITNFHLPESSLLMLVCAFAGTEHVLAAYRHAVAERYRFFSYGDAMFVTAAQGMRSATGTEPSP